MGISDKMKMKQSEALKMLQFKFNELMEQKKYKEAQDLFNNFFNKNIEAVEKKERESQNGKD